MPLTSHQPELNGPFIRDPDKRALIARYRGAFTKVLGHPMEFLTTEQVYKIALVVKESELRSEAGGLGPVLEGLLKRQAKDAA